ncbi:cytosolic phospholipase A2 zeta-like, partial [Clarias magur]
KRKMMVKLHGAYIEEQVISALKTRNFMQTLRYHINKDLETQIELQAVDIFNIFNIMFYFYYLNI